MVGWYGYWFAFLDEICYKPGVSKNLCFFGLRSGRRTTSVRGFNKQNGFGMVFFFSFFVFLRLSLILQVIQPAFQPFSPFRGAGELGSRGSRVRAIWKKHWRRWKQGLGSGPRLRDWNGTDLFWGNAGLRWVVFLFFFSFSTLLLWLL